MAAAAAAAAGPPASDVEERIAVCIRIRPFSQSEAAQGAFCAWKPIPDYAGHLQQYTPAEEPVPGSTYAFDHVFGSDQDTSSIYGEIAHPITKSVAEGYNGTIFAYGQTAAGKTFTMQGSEEHPGIVRMAVDDIMEHIANTPDRTFLVRVSYWRSTTRRFATC
ncbi:hypothetical protein FNF28_06932 [Cafeteria roenbergensis]|uniref:Kinesin motor domain-containing protein n=1 Tax=Cafeteria roenbergensis TaxID=33653 RepID=A0A5A8CLC0_CAFRO|nr:hypothetical protein FNF28_06932 [Cafeteria roenbergensis]